MTTDGLLRVIRIGPGLASARAEVTFSNGESYLVWDADIVREAQACGISQEPVRVEFATSPTGNRYIRKIVPL